ncbi:unnamed protein product [Protopolystoma xenopodis]|uniref:Reverse transcriptase domain-containing protein n=1 Tax=Protopolystoma xenopodis TaxID=117903 RepID=A0A3S5CE93_9PLAT|nr:unnamed protein product [Protopolystoma xenopodis]
MAPDKLKEAKFMFNDIINDDIICPSKSAWVFQLYLVQNKALKVKNIFFKVDLKTAYFQILVDTDNIEKTAVITPFGFFKFNRRNVIYGLDTVFVYIDKILIASDDSEQQKQHFVSLFKRLLHHHRVISSEQCVFGVDSLTFLRFRIDTHGMLTSQERVLSINNFWLLRTPKALRNFLCNADLHLVTNAFDRAVGDMFYQVFMELLSLALYSRKFTSEEQRYITFSRVLLATSIARANSAKWTTSHNLTAMLAMSKEHATSLHTASPALAWYCCAYNIIDYQAMQKHMNGSGVKSPCDLSTKTHRRFVYSAMRKLAFQAVHDLTYPGLNAPRKLITSCVILPGMQTDLDKWSKACPFYQNNKVHWHTKAPIVRFNPIHMKTTSHLPLWTVSNNGQKLFQSQTYRSDSFKNLFRSLGLKVLQTDNQHNRQRQVVRILSFHPTIEIIRNENDLYVRLRV